MGGSGNPGFMAYSEHVQISRESSAYGSVRSNFRLAEKAHVYSSARASFYLLKRKLCIHTYGSIRAGSCQLRKLCIWLSQSQSQFLSVEKALLMAQSDPILVYRESSAYSSARASFYFLSTKEKALHTYCNYGSIRASSSCLLRKLCIWFNQYWFTTLEKVIANGSVRANFYL